MISSNRPQADQPGLQHGVTEKTGRHTAARSEPCWQSAGIHSVDSRLTARPEQLIPGIWGGKGEIDYAVNRNQSSAKRQSVIPKLRAVISQRRF